jgi:hypothetical protein
MTVQELYDHCSDTTETQCMLYLGGLWEGLMIAKKVCGEGVTWGQMRLVFLKWAKQNPEHLNEDMGLGAALSLFLAFPCN